MALRVWLHEGHDGEAGVTAFAPDALGFATWAEDEAALLAKLRPNFADYSRWRAARGLPVAEDGAVVELLGRRAGNEILFPTDHEAATSEEIELAIALLAASRTDLVADLETAPEGALDWDRPYRRFAAWADWRTVRAILAHVANGETHYYARNVGHTPVSPPADPRGDWRTFLPRAETNRFLAALARAPDRARVRAVDHGFGEGWWSVRKALRRLVAHERCHGKRIRRTLGAYRASHGGGG